MPLHGAGGGQGILTDLRQTIFSCFVDGIVHDSAEIMELLINICYRNFYRHTLSIIDNRKWYSMPRTRIEEVRMVLCRGNFSLRF